jgi:hypothetical protein
MAKSTNTVKKTSPKTSPVNPINETILFEHISKIIENRKSHAAAYVNREVNLMFWEIGRYINTAILDFKRAPYGKGIFSTLSRKLTERYGKSFFVERQKHMTIDGDDFQLDLLFYHRVLRRLVAVELKLGRFKPQYKGQMELYLKWLDKYERKEEENTPIGLILCTEASRSQIELLEMDKAGIAVAEYWTVLPPKNEFEKKIKEILVEAKERLERRKSLPIGEIQKQIEYFIDKPEDDDDDD